MTRTRQELVAELQRIAGTRPLRGSTDEDALLQAATMLRASDAEPTERAERAERERDEWRDAANLSACEADSGIGMDELRERTEAAEASLAQEKVANAAAHAQIAELREALSAILARHWG